MPDARRYKSRGWGPVCDARCSCYMYMQAFGVCQGPASLSLSLARNYSSRKAKGSGVFVRREKASVFSGCNSHPAAFAPAGSNRSDEGGNDIVEAFDGKSRKAVPR